MTTGLPTLSQIQAWGTEHLIEAADHWTATADRWDDVYGQVGSSRSAWIGKVNHTMRWWSGPPPTR
jgi:hypothetical protein